jgi:hypothetical protein
MEDCLHVTKKIWWKTHLKMALKVQKQIYQFLQTQRPSFVHVLPLQQCLVIDVSIPHHLA